MTGAPGLPTDLHSSGPKRSLRGGIQAAPVFFRAGRRAIERQIREVEARRAVVAEVADDAERTTEQEEWVKVIQQKLDRLDEAFLTSESIDLTSYSRQRDKVREELTLAKIEHHTEAVDELDESSAAHRTSNPLIKSQLLYH